MLRKHDRYRSFAICLPLLLIIVYCMCCGEILKISAVSSKSGTTYSSSRYSTSNNSSGTNNTSKSNSSYNYKSSSSTTLLPDDGSSVTPATSQNWDELLSDLDQTADKNEFTFSDTPNSLGFWGSKLSWLGFALIVISIFGFTYVLRSNIRYKKNLNARTSGQVAAKRYINDIKAVDNNNKQTDIRSRKSAPKTVYRDGYGYSKSADNVATRNTKSCKHSNTSEIPGQTSFDITNKLDNKNTSAKHFLADDSQSGAYTESRHFNQKKQKSKSENGKIAKREEFWNDFFDNKR